MQKDNWINNLLRFQSYLWLWCQICEGSKIWTFTDKSQLFATQNIDKLLILQIFDTKSCLLIIFEDEWWNFHFDTSNTKISKKVWLKTHPCESCHDIWSFSFSFYVWIFTKDVHTRENVYSCGNSDRSICDRLHSNYGNSEQYI